jgi:protease-4
VQKDMREVYNHFLAGVAEGRRMKVQDVDKIAQGRVWTGERARRLGLVDELGGLHTAIARARELARISAKERVSLLLLPPRRSLLEKILDLAAGAESLPAMLSSRAWLQRLESLAGQPVWALPPAMPEVR